MRQQIEAAATMLGVTTEYIFQLAYKECSGCIWGLQGPKTLHYRWWKGFIREPPYVKKWLEQNVKTIH